MFESLEENEPREPKEPEPANWTGVLIGAVTLPVALLFRHFGKFDMGLSVSICLGMMLFAIGVCWDLRKRFWFWAVIVLLAALHVPLILMIQWPHHWVPGVALLPIGLADFLIIVGVVRFVENFIVKAVPAED